MFNYKRSFIITAISLIYFIGSVNAQEGQVSIDGYTTDFAISFKRADNFYNECKNSGYSYNVRALINEAMELIKAPVSKAGNIRINSIIVDLGIALNKKNILTSALSCCDKKLGNATVLGGSDEQVKALRGQCIEALRNGTPVNDEIYKVELGNICKEFRRKGGFFTSTNRLVPAAGKLDIVTDMAWEDASSSNYCQRGSNVGSRWSCTNLSFIYPISSAIQELSRACLSDGSINQDANINLENITNIGRWLSIYLPRDTTSDEKIAEEARLSLRMVLIEIDTFCKAKRNNPKICKTVCEEFVSDVNNNAYNKTFNAVLQNACKTEITNTNAKDYTAAQELCKVSNLTKKDGIAGWFISDDDCKNKCNELRSGRINGSWIIQHCKASGLGDLSAPTPARTNTVQRANDSEATSICASAGRNFEKLPATMTQERKNECKAWCNTFNQDSVNSIKNYCRISASTAASPPPGIGAPVSSGVVGPNRNINPSANNPTPPQATRSMASPSVQMSTTLKGSGFNGTMSYVSTADQI
ncbi:MAG: hypothetical protein LBU68_00720, partial [Rickettsiales bacterium]|nr:hypothetical protein [Rickettsiales bacterium]